MAKREVAVACEELTAGALAIVCENPFEGTIVLDKRGLPRPDSGTGHGIGLLSVRTAAERNGKMMEVDVADDRFKVFFVMFG